MTIIATKDGIMAADSQLTVEAYKYQALRPKIIQRRDGSILGASGLTVLCNTIQDWFMNGENGALTIDDEDTGYLVLRPDGRVFYTDDKRHTLEVPATYAFGAMSASYMALGAMHAGACARTAVKIAIENTINVGGQVTSLSL